MDAPQADFLRDRISSKHRAFVRAIDGVTLDEAIRFATPLWPDHRWGIGQNGSIAGIVYHVAAWKQLTLPALQGRSPLSRAEFVPADCPEWTDWTAIVAWYTRVSSAWTDSVTTLPDSEFDATISWEGNSFSIAKLIMEISDHDVQHASQVEYLRQLLLMRQ